MKRVIAAVLVSLVLTGESRAEVVTAETLAALCNYNSLPQQYQKFAKNSCNGTIRAYLEYNSGMKTHYKLKVPFCLSEGGSSLAGAASTFMGYLQQNPHHKKNPAAIVFAEAMGSVSKCK
jgi:hypothetical protein